MLDGAAALLFSKRRQQVCDMLAYWSIFSTSTCLSASTPSSSTIVYLFVLYHQTYILKRHDPKYAANVILLHFSVQVSILFSACFFFLLHTLPPKFISPKNAICTVNGTALLFSKWIACLCNVQWPENSRVFTYIYSSSLLCVQITQVRLPNYKKPIIIISMSETAEV
jgi:hypothetical protein